VTLHEKLRRAGVRTVLSRGLSGRGTRISFLLSARHQLSEIDRAMEALAEFLHTSVDVFL